MKLPTTRERVEESTSDFIDEQIHRQVEANVAHYARRLDEIQHRPRQLDEEWDMERTLETNAGIIALAGVLLGAMNRKWLFLPAIVAGFLVQHALQGWCPPVPIFRRLGVRTMKEIDQERYALKALRGDFKGVDEDSGNGEARIERAVQAAR